jgi:VIT1/CCC1 family predicted Fe2+/Mn2+ transporter/rubrerythrin
MATQRAYLVNPKLLEALEKNWQAEKSGVYTYRTLADREPDPVRKQKLSQLAEAEERHASLWASRLRELGGAEPIYRGSPTGEANTLRNRVGGHDLALRRLEVEESRDIAKYGRQLKELGDEPSVAILQQVLADERERYRVLSGHVRRGIARTSSSDAAAVLGNLLARQDRGRPCAAGWVGDAINGVNDGLGTIFGIVSGVSGATLGNSKWVRLSSLAGMIASALSMGSGAFHSAKSEREIYEGELARERKAIEMNGAEARKLQSLYCQVKGIPEEDADNIVEELARSPEQMLRALSLEPLNSTEDALRNPWTSAASGGLSTAVGAFIPIVPFFFLGGYTAVIVSAIVSLLAHFGVGAAKSLITVRSWWGNGLEMTAVGTVEGLATYAIGLGLGHLDISTPRYLTHSSQPQNYDWKASRKRALRIHTSRNTIQTQSRWVDSI